MNARQTAVSSLCPRGFTLIELLVVISIITVLMSLLLPSLGKAREVANNAVAQSNIKQNCYGIAYYLEDHAQTYPQAVQDGAITSVTARASALWYNAIDTYIGQQVLEYTASDATIRNHVPIKQHPAWLQMDPSIRNNNRTIKMNDRFSVSSGFKFYREPQIVQPFNTVLFVEGRAQDLRMTDTTIAQNFSATEGTVGLRYANGANVGFTDAHVTHHVFDINVTANGDRVWFLDGTDLTWRLE
jgi:prepilin-type N-terminal cleavage/methylation domain-containing protein/prepilin-type processing-associated H-X9-DG protein